MTITLTTINSPPSYVKVTKPSTQRDAEKEKEELDTRERTMNLYVRHISPWNRSFEEYVMESFEENDYRVSFTMTAYNKIDCKAC